MPLSADEVTPGIVVHLDTTILRALGAAMTNAVRDDNGDRAVTGPHDFLVVGVDVASAHCTAVPLFPKSAVGNQPLLNTLKSGGSSAWRTADTFFSHWQHWRVPIASVVHASVHEETTPTTRRRYSASDRPALDDVRAWETRNRAEYREA